VIGSGGARTDTGVANTGGTVPATGGRGGGTGGQTPGSGGVVATGGSPGTGGVIASGGQSDTGGATGSGGTQATGGIAGSGGVRTDASVAGTGGSTLAADAGRDGATVTGGVAGSGGATRTGGSAILAATPPMGWNSWNNFGCNPSESLIKKTADAMVSSGMAAVGYQYVNIDDCWMSGRTAAGELQWDTAKFPSGIPALAEYVHGKGLKLGIYETPSSTTCAGKTGGAGHEVQDAQTFAKWGIDYLKYDHCRTTDMGAFARMGTALKATGRPIVYSINTVYGAGSCVVPPSCSIDATKIANLWRIEFDITNTWKSVTGLIDFDKPLAQYAGPGHWNDPDMLEVGRGMTADEDRSHFGMWAILAAPLITGNDLSTMSATTKAILTNTDIIAVNQDPLGKQGTLINSSNSKEIWLKQLSGTNVRAVALFNRSASASSMSVTWAQIGLASGSATVRDLYAQKDLGPFTDSYTAASVPSHGIVMLKIASAL
jgi:alpha-galactosidase